MQKNLYLIIVISFSLASCYTYQVKKQAEEPVDNMQQSKTVANNTSQEKKKSKPLNTQQPPVPINVQEKLAPNKNFKIDVDGTTYKIIVDRWENDSLVAHPVRNPQKILKFHKNQINSEKIAEKRFSQPIADIITVTAYVGIGALIYFLLR